MFWLPAIIAQKIIFLEIGKSKKMHWHIYIIYMVTPKSKIMMCPSWYDYLATYKHCGNSPNSLKIAWDPVKGKNKSSYLDRVHGTQNDQLELTISMQKLVWKIWIGSCNNIQNVSKFDEPNQTFKFRHKLTNILGFGAYFLNPIFALKPWAIASRFE